MKKVITIVAAAMFVFQVQAQTLYVSSVKANLFSAPDSSGTKSVQLKRGDTIEVLEKNDKWLKVESSAGNGWIQSLFVSDKKPSGTITVLGSAEKSGRVQSRKRASSDVTAASARGLVHNDNVSSRSRTSDIQNFNPQDLTEVESVHISENELKFFLAEGGVQ